MPAMLEHQLCELEMRIAFMDDMLHSLNATVALQGQQIDELHNQVCQLCHELGAVKTTLSHDIHLESPPPHY